MLRIRPDRRYGSGWRAGISSELPLGCLHTASRIFPTMQQNDHSPRERSHTALWRQSNRSGLLPEHPYTPPS